MSVKQTQPKAAKTASKIPDASRKAQPGLPAWAPVAILVVTGLIYLPALQNGITNIDDDFYLLSNPYLRDASPAGLWNIFTHFYSYNYHPFTTLSNLIEFQLFGLNPLPYHFFNVVLHLLNTWLVYNLVKQLTAKPLTPLIVMALFAVHPMHVESVAWIAERKDVLYTAFYLLSIIAYLKYLDNNADRKNYIYCLLWFVASLFSKSAAVTLPVLLILLDWYKGRKINIKSLLEKIPFCALSVLFGILALQSQKMGGALSNISVTYSIIDRIFVFTGGLSCYFLYLVLPFNLSAIHYFPNLVNGALPWYFYLSLPFVLALVWLVFIRKSKYSRDLRFGALFFLICMSVMLQIVTVGLALFAERYSYVSYIGLFFIAGQWLSDLWEGKNAQTVKTTLAIVLVVFIATSFLRIGVWKDTETVFGDIIAKNEGNKNLSFLYWYWGGVKKADGSFRDAIEKFSEAIKLDTASARNYTGRGEVSESLGDLKSAIADYTTAIRLKPDDARTYDMRGWAYFQMHDTAKAMQDYNRAIKLDSSLAEAFNNRGWAYYQANDTTRARADFDKAIVLDEKSTKPYFNRAALEASLGNTQAALGDYDLILKYHPKDSIAFFDRGIVHLNMGDTAGACADWRKSVDNGNLNARNAINVYCRRY